MERRRHSRQVISEGSELTARIILSGGSLLEKTETRSIEIGTTPLNISQGGVCLWLKLNVPWETLTPKKEVDLLLSHGGQEWYLRAVVVRQESDRRTLGLQFDKPLPSLVPFLLPVELQ